MWTKRIGNGPLSLFVGVVTLLVTILSLLPMVGCRSSELTRAKAKQILEALDEFKTARPVTISLTPQEIQLGSNLGLWRTSTNIYMGFTDLDFTPFGKKFFTSSQPGLATGNLYVQTAAPHRAYIAEITGVTDAPLSGGEHSVKQVEFTWNWDFTDFSENLRPLFKDHPLQARTVTMRLYDDGWRIAQ